LSVLPRVDWTQPWFAPYSALGQTVAATVQGGATVVEALNALGAQLFVAQHSLPPGEAFEAFIARTASVPTRNNLHDFFSGLVWLQQPALKRRLNQLQALAIAEQGVGPRRGRLRDVLTRFDESGALLRAPPALWQALHARDWQALFVTHRALWRRAEFTLFGHALLEQLTVAPRKPLTAFVWPGADALGASAVDWAAARLLPLPVCGVPLWWAGNDAPAFYGDTSVFRPAPAQP
jgi:hypothetical protein